MKVLSDRQIFDLLGLSKPVSGVIFVDLNNTLIDDNICQINIDKGQLIAEVKKIENLGFRVGLCSDSPHDPLKNWGMRHGIDGPVISENGMLLNGEAIFEKEFDISEIKKKIKNWLVTKRATILPEVLAEEFGGHIASQDTGVAFGKGRICSISLFCFKNGTPDPDMTTELQKFLLGNLLSEFSLDPAYELGNIAIHYGNFRRKKARILGLIGKILQKNNITCWMIGDSMSDITKSEFCKVAIVGNAKPEVKKMADIVSDQSFTKGVIQLLKVTITNTQRRT